jgi:type IV secretory pathway VirB10-like protein
MADQNLNAVGCLGRALTLIGILWAGLVVLGGVGVLSELGMSGAFLAGFGGSLIPALLLLAAGRALRRRATSIKDRTEPQQASTGAQDTGKRVPTIQLEPRPTPVPLPAPQPPPAKPTKPAPRPADPVTQADPAAETTPDAAPARSTSPARPKTSQELLDEARKRWGGGKKR